LPDLTLPWPPKSRDCETKEATFQPRKGRRPTGLYALQRAEDTFRVRVCSKMNLLTEGNEAEGKGNPLTEGNEDNEGFHVG